MTLVRAFKPGAQPAEYLFMTRELAEAWAERQVLYGYVVELEGVGR